METYRSKFFALNPKIIEAGHFSDTNGIHEPIYELEDVNSSNYASILRNLLVMEKRYYLLNRHIAENKAPISSEFKENIAKIIAKSRCSPDIIKAVSKSYYAQIRSVK